MKGARWLAVAIAFAGCQVERPSAARSAVVGGDPDPGDPAVVALVARRTRCEELDASLLCTGTLVAPRVVLTAAHCLDVFGEDGQYEVYFGSRLGPGDGRFALVTAARRHPAYDPQTHEHDLALLRLAVPAGVEPASVASGLPEPVAGQMVRVVGFGATAAGQLATGEKRSGWMSIGAVTATAVSSAPGPAMSCTGDSGGPVFVTDGGGREWLLGVSASGDPGCRTSAFNVRADAAAGDFILPFVQETLTAPAGYGDTSAAATGFCARGCASSQDCPAGLSCVADQGGGGRCLLLSLREGSFGATCAADGECSDGPCARLLPEGPDACRCFRSCSGTPGAGGCATAGPGDPWPLLTALLLGSIALLLQENRCNRKRRPSRST